MFIGYMKIHSPWPSAPKVTANLKSYLVKVFSLKQRSKSNTLG